MPRRLDGLTSAVLALSWSSQVLAQEAPRRTESAQAAPSASAAASTAPLPPLAPPPTAQGAQGVAASSEATVPTPPPPPQGAAADSCVPDCRPGYLCYQGSCVSACNPPCPSGTVCTAALSCIPLANTSSDPRADGGRPPRRPGRDPETIRRRYATRLAHRLTPRIAAGIQFSIIDPGGDLTPGPGGGLHAAYRQNATPQLGLQIRAGAGLGSFEIPREFRTNGSSSNVLYGTFFADLAPHFSFARAHVGPLLRIVHVDLGSIDSVGSDTSDFLIGPVSATGVMLGLHGAMSIGAEEGLDAFISLLFSENTVAFELGLSYAFIDLKEPDLPEDTPLMSYQ